MRALLVAAALAYLPATAFGQTATATGTGTAVSSSSSRAAAVAISGQGGQGGTVNINSSVPAVQTVNTVASGTQTLRNVPNVFAPALAPAGIETCLGSVSGGAAVVGTGASFGSTVPDYGCSARLDARTLWSFGLKKAAVVRLCLNPDMYNSMPEVCALYMPQRAPEPVFPNPFAALFAPAPVVAPAPAGGPVAVTIRSTGQTRLCDVYDETRHRCRVWSR